MSLNLALWIVTIILATILLISTSKIFIPREKIASAGKAAQWILDFSPAAVRTIGVLELLAAAGLILPAVTGIAPIMVPVTATCVALLFTGAVITRLRRGEKWTFLIDVVYLAMAVFVAWGRFAGH